MNGKAKKILATIEVYVADHGESISTLDILNGIGATLTNFPVDVTYPFCVSITDVIFEDIKEIEL